jgi:exopolysaccharide biosynthesis polyprenyl glycosylphosphotransferase
LLGDLVILVGCYFFLWSMETETIPRPGIVDPHTPRFLALALPALLLSLLLGGSYRRVLGAGPGYGIICLLRGWLLGSAVLALGLAWFPIPISRSTVAAFLGLALIGLLLWRNLFLELRRALERRGIGRWRVAVYGEDERAAALVRSVAGAGELPYRLVAVIGEPPVEPPEGAVRLRTDGAWREAFDVLAPEDVLVPLGSEPPEGDEVLAHCRARGIPVRRVATASQVVSGEARIHEFLGIPWELQHRRDLRPIDERVKRATDLVLGSIALILLAPLLLLIAVLIKLDTPGPVFYKQRRLTKNGREFEMFKFRSMVVDAEKLLDKVRHLNEADGPIFKIRDDPRVTRVGRVLRRTSLDELPQLFNVLRGELSLVGPRPPVPEEVARYEPWQRRRLEVVQGMTGLWQVSGRSRLSFEEMVLLDIYYIDHWSLMLDLEILLDTIPAVLFARGAY